MSKKYKIDSRIPYNNRNFIKILDFYLFHCPVSYADENKTKVSSMGFTFEMRNIIGSRLTALKKEIIHNGILEVPIENSNGDNYFINELRKYDAQLNDSYYERIFYIENKSLGRTKSIFYYIRNAFAHGSFLVVSNGSDLYYIFNCDYKQKIKARIRLKEKTLLKWIEIVEQYTH